MPSLGTFLSDSRSLIAAAILAAVIVVILIYGISRYAFGRRLRMAGGRPRQPRLGVVDAYDLDRQRQLVLVRRDNVEHLVMIGGPNDLLIESAFVRAQPSVAVPPGREKEAMLAPGLTAALPLPGLAPEPADDERITTVQPAPSLPQPTVQSYDLPPMTAQAPRAPAPRAPSVDLGRPILPNDLGPLSDLPAPGPAPEAPATPVPPPADPDPQPDLAASPEPATPVPLRPSRFPTAAARPTGSALPPRPPLAGLRATIAPPGAAAPVAPTTGDGGARPPGPGFANRPTPLTPMQRGTSAASLRRDPPAMPPGDTPLPNIASLPSGPVVAPPEPVMLQPPTPSPPIVRPPDSGGITLDSIESLEQEMARLLGRAAGDRADGP